MKKFLTKLLAIVIVFSMCFGTFSGSTEEVYAKESSDYVIKVNKGTNCVTIYKGKKPIKAMICSPSVDTPTGTFYTPVKYRWHEMIGNCYAQYCTRITGGILFHSVWYYRKGDNSTMSVAAYNVMGQKASHGCVRLTCEDAKWIYDNCALKTKVIIFNGKKKDDPLGKPTFTPLTTTSRMSWDPTDPDPANPFHKKKPSIKAISKKVEYKSNGKALKLVEIKDSAGNVITKKTAKKIKTKGKVNTSKLGKYKVKYTVVDKLGHKKVKTITFKVVDTKKPKITGAKKKKNIKVGTTLNVLTGVKANLVSGKNITKKIKVSVVNSATGEKLAVTKGNVTFTKAGKYTVTYSATNKKKTRVKKVTYTVVEMETETTTVTETTTAPDEETTVAEETTVTEENNQESTTENTGGSEEETSVAAENEDTNTTDNN